MAEVELVVARLEHLDAALDSPERLSESLGGAEVAPGWEVFPEAVRGSRDRLAAAGNGEGNPWGTHLFLISEPRTLVGWGGFKGPPADGTVEVGYSVSPEVEGRGIATAAVAAMVAKAEAAGVASVIAHTLPERNASGTVLARNGFELEDENATEADNHVWRWRLPIGGESA